MTRLTNEDLALVGLRRELLPKAKPERIKALIAANKKQADTWSLTKQDRQRLYKQNEVLQRILAEIGA